MPPARSDSSSSSSSEDENAAALASVAVSFDFIQAEQKRVALQGQQNLGKTSASKSDAVKAQGSSGRSTIRDDASDDEGNPKEEGTARGQEPQTLDGLELKIAASLNKHLDQITSGWWKEAGKKSKKSHKREDPGEEEEEQQPTTVEQVDPQQQQDGAGVLDLGPGVRLFRKVPAGTHALVLPGAYDQPWVPQDHQLRSVEVREHLEAARALKELTLLEQALSKEKSKVSHETGDDTGHVELIRKAMKRLRKSLDMESTDTGRHKAVKKALKRCAVAGEEVMAGAVGFQSRAQLDDAMAAVKLAILGTKGKKGRHTKHPGEVVEARTWIPFNDRTDRLLGKIPSLTADTKPS